MADKTTGIAVIGAGAIGGVTAALLHRAGYNVQVVCNSPELAAQVADRGLHITGLRGDFSVPVPAVAYAADLGEQKDLIIMATKAVDLEKAAREIAPCLKDSSIVISVQNGICEPVLARILDKTRVMGCIVGWSATMHTPGELEISAPGPMILGNMFDPEDGRLPEVADILRSVYPVRISRNMMGARYAKLVINAAIILGVVCGLPLGRVLAIKKARSIMIAIIRECMAVSDAMGITVEPFFANLDYHFFSSGMGVCHHLLLRLVGFKYRRLRSSGLTSLERGRRTEIDYLNGYVARKGREYGVATPVNDAVIAIVKEIESGARPVSPRNFEDRRFSGL